MASDLRGSGLAVEGSFIVDRPGVRFALQGVKANLQEPKGPPS